MRPVQVVLAHLDRVIIHADVAGGSGGDWAVARRERRGPGGKIFQLGRRFAGRCPPCGGAWCCPSVLLSQCGGGVCWSSCAAAQTRELWRLVLTW